MPDSSQTTRPAPCRRIATDYRRPERALDEIAADAMADERLRGSVLPFRKRT